MTGGQTFDILDDFTPRVRNVELKLRIKATKQLWTYEVHDWSHIRGRKLNTQHFIGLVIFDNYLIFLQKYVKLKIWFFKQKILIYFIKQGGKPIFKVFSN